MANAFNMDKQPSVLIAGIHWPPETFLLRLIEGLSKKGQSVCLATDSRPSKEWLSKFNIDWRWCPSWDVPYFQRVINFLLLISSLPFSYPNRIKKIYKFVQKHKGARDKLRAFYAIAPLAGIRCDLVYFPWVLAADRYMEWFQNIQTAVIVSLRGSMVNIDPLIPIYGEKVQRTMRRIFEGSTVVHCVSEAILTRAMNYGLDPDKASVICPAVDPNYFFPCEGRNSRNSIFHVVTTGSLIWLKGYEYSLSAIRILKDTGCRLKFSIIGDGLERQRVVSTIHDLDLQEDVVLLGKCTPEQVRNALRTADVFLLSSLSEGISNAVLEAMACGLPIVTTDCGGMREAVTDGVEGYVVPMRDCDAMASALKELWQNPELRQQMGQAGRQTVLRRFTLEQQTQQWVNLYQGLIRVKAKQ